MSKPEPKFAIRLKLLRVERGDTQKDIAKHLNISQQTYSNMEKGVSKLNTEMIDKICDYYGISSDYLLGRDTPPISNTVIPQAMTLERKQLLAEITEEVLTKLNEKI